MHTKKRLRDSLRKAFRGLWLSRDFRRLWASLTITSFGAQITNLALPLTAALLDQGGVADELIASGEYRDADDEYDALAQEGVS